jgi:hypothetical protein
MTKQTPLTGKQLKEAVRNGAPVRVVFEPDNPADGTIDCVAIPEPALVEGWYIVGDMDFCPADWKDDEPVSGEELDGWTTVYPGDLGTADDQRMVRVAKFLEKTYGGKKDHAKIAEQVRFILLEVV